MRFSFEVGETERHAVAFYFNQFWGNLDIRVDGKKQLRDFRIISFKLTKAYELYIGVQEGHNVRIEKTRKLFLAGFRKSSYKVFVDGELAHEYVGI